MCLSYRPAPRRFDPLLPGVDLPGVFAVRTIPDSRRIRSWITDHSAKTAVVVGGGFIGLEMVENLIHRELSVTVLEKLPQVMPPLDPEMAVPLMEHLAAKGVQLHLGDGLARIEERDGGWLGCRRRERRALARRSRHPGHRRAARDHACQGRRSRDRPARRHSRRCADAYYRSEYLGSGRRRRSAGRAYGSRNGAAARGTGEPPRTSCRRIDRRACDAFPRRAGNCGGWCVGSDRRVDRRQRERTTARRRHELSESLPSPGSSRRLLPRCTRRFI